MNLLYDIFEEVSCAKQSEIKIRWNRFIRKACRFVVERSGYPDEITNLTKYYHNCRHALKIEDINSISKKHGELIDELLERTARLQSKGD